MLRTRMLFRTILALAAATVALANPLAARQATNTNPQISEVLDTLSVQMRQHLFDIGEYESVREKFMTKKPPLPDTMQANGTATDGTIGAQVQQMITDYTTASSSLLAIPVSAGSTTVQPTNIELSRVFGETLQYVTAPF